MKRLDVNRMFAQSFDATGVGVMKCTVEPNMEAMECFANEQFGNQVVDGPYSATVIYTTLVRIRIVRGGRSKERCQ